MKFLRSKRGRVIAAAVLLLALFLIRPGAQRLQARIVRSMSLALGRQVDVGSVTLRLLPQPGFDLKSFVVRDDPEFSAEPLLRSQEVTAALRVSSLLRGRLEIARLSLTEPSLNLVRNPQGHWNIEHLLERAAQVPIAPTGKARTEARPAFPYIEAVRGRINIKFGQEKTPYALNSADFGLWQDSENSWGMRLTAQPLRTDFNLTDTGVLEVNGAWQRASSLRETPLQFTLEWDRAQLGQVTKLAYGNDKGWRGTVKLSATLSGTPADLNVSTDGSIQDFRRYDIPGGGAMRLAARCSGHYSSVDRVVSKIACQAPVGSGVITLEGSGIGRLSSPTYDLALIARNVPMQALVELARHSKKGLPDDLVANGKLDANFRIVQEHGGDHAPSVWTGGGETLGLGIVSKVTKTELVADRIAFTISQDGDLKTHTKNTFNGVHREPWRPIAETQLDFGPFNLGLGMSAPATLRGRISRSGYDLSIQGEADVQQLLQALRTVGSPAPQPAADGVAKLDVQIGGKWAGFGAPKATGKLLLRSVRAEVRGLNAPLEIASANLLLTPDEINVQNIVATVAGSTLRGSVLLSRQCTASCPVHFDLHADEIATDELHQLLGTHPKARPWYRFLNPSDQSGAPFLASLHAVGMLTANRVMIHNLMASRVSANVELENGKLLLTDLRGDVLGGKHRGEWKADFTAKSPEYSGSGSLERVALGQLAEAMQDDWITGTVSATYHATLSGRSKAELLSSASTSLQLDAHDGLLPRFVLSDGSGPLQMHRFVGRFLLRSGMFEIQEGKLETSGGAYEVSGTASLSRILDLKLRRSGAPGFSITGTLTEPHVVPTATTETRAALKP